MFFPQTTIKRGEREGETKNRMETDGEKMGRGKEGENERQAKLAKHILGIYFKVASVLFRSRVSRSILF